MHEYNLVALSVQQPWAWLIVQGFKDVENRDCKTAMVGYILIHPSKKIDRFAHILIQMDHPEILLPEKFETGGIVGRVDIVDCVTDSKSKWFCGKYGFMLKNALPINFVPFKGALKFFKVPNTIINPADRESIYLPF